MSPVCTEGEVFSSNDLTLTLTLLLALTLGFWLIRAGLSQHFAERRVDRQLLAALVRRINVDFPDQDSVFSTKVHVSDGTAGDLIERDCARVLVRHLG